MDPAHRHAHQRLWTDLARHAQPGYVAAPACLLAFTAWQSGDGALANLALDRALADTPGYSMALLLRDAIDAGAPPSMAVPPMTPEEVAASYDTQPRTAALKPALPELVTGALADRLTAASRPRMVLDSGGATCTAATPSLTDSERWRWCCSTGWGHVGSCGSAGPGDAIRGVYRLVSLAAAVGSATGLSLRSLRPFKIFSWTRKIHGPGFAGSFADRWKNILPVRAGQLRSRPIAPACPPASEHPATGPRHRVPLPEGAHHGRHRLFPQPSSSPAPAAAPRSPSPTSYYVDGAGQLCTANCTTPMPAGLESIEPPF